MKSCAGFGLAIAASLCCAGQAYAGTCKVNATVAAGAARAQGYNIHVNTTGVNPGTMCQKIGLVGGRRSGPGFAKCRMLVFTGYATTLKNGWRITNVNTSGAKRYAVELKADGSKGLSFDFGSEGLTPGEDVVITLRTITFVHDGPVDCRNGWRAAFE